MLRYAQPDKLYVTLNSRIFSSPIRSIESISMKKRWLIYLLIGVLFGIFDFYYQTWTQPLFPFTPFGNIALMVAVLSVWLVMVIPIAIREAKASRSVWLAAAASAFSWSVSIISYYLFMAVKLILIGQPGREEMHFSNRSDPYFWSNIKSVFIGDILAGIGEWILVALIGGCLVGLVAGWIVLKRQNASLPAAQG